MNSSSKSQQYNDYSYNILLSLKMKSNKSLFPLVCIFRKRTPVLVGRGHFGGSGQWLKRKINTDHLLSKHLNNDKCPNIVKLITHVSKCIDNRKVPKIAPMPPILYEKYTWLHFTALIIKSYLHWEVQNIHIPFVPYIKENFLYPFVIWKPAWKPPLYYGYSVDLASFPLPL